MKFVSTRMLYGGTSAVLLAKKSEEGACGIVMTGFFGGGGAVSGFLRRASRCPIMRLTWPNLRLYSG